MRNKFLIILLAALSIAGCSSNEPPPPAAQTKTPGSTALYVQAQAEKWSSGILQLATKDAKGCGQFAASVLPNLIDDDYIVEIEGDHDIFFHIARTETANECNFFGMFYANKGSDYTVKLEIKNQQCEFSLKEKLPSGVQIKTSTYPAYVSNVDDTKVCQNKSKLY